MAFKYDEKAQIVVDSGRDLILRCVGGRDEHSYNVFTFTTPDCRITVYAFYKINGLNFQWLDEKNEFGRLKSVLTYENDAFIELSLSGLRVEAGQYDHLIYGRDLKEAIACHYRYNDRYHGPIFFCFTGNDGSIVREQFD